jgi:hypothetical protein
VLTSTALTAIRMLGVDIANLTTRCAIFQAASEELQELANHVDMRAWEPRTLGEGEDTQYLICVPPDQREAVEQILTVIDGLR